MRAFGWTPPPEGHRGTRTRASASDLLALAPHVELAHLHPATDQGPLGSCTGHAAALALYLRLLFQGAAGWFPSPLDLYRGGRMRAGTVERDAGAMLADVLTHAETAGFAPDTLWPFAEHGLDFRGPPPVKLERERGRARLLTWEPLDWDLDTLRWELAAGHPVVMGARIYESFERLGEDATVPLPSGVYVGGHALCLVGYSDARKAFRIQNSWGSTWGDQGRAWLPYAYATHVFWTGELHAVRAVRVAAPTVPPPR